MESGWLVRDGEVLAALEIAASRAERRRGLRGRDPVDYPPALLLERCRQVHTFGVRAVIDVAFCGRDGTVLTTARLAPGRVSRWCRRAAFAVEAPGGAFDRWGLRAGDVVEIAGPVLPERS